MAHKNNSHRISLLDMGSARQLRENICAQEEAARGFTLILRHFTMSPEAGALARRAEAMAGIEYSKALHAFLTASINFI